MRITIGEVVDEMMPYCRNIELSMAGSFPFIKADIGDSSKYTKGHIYIVQVDDHQYSVCDYHDDLHGNRYLPTQNSHKPFVKEKELIRFMSQSPNDGEEKDSTVLNIGYLSFLDHLYNLLFQYKIIKVNPKLFSKQLLDSATLPLFPRIQKTLESIFKDQGIPDPKIKDLITTVKNSGKLNIRGIKPKDVIELESKFNSIGINLVIQNNIITNVHFEKI